MQSSFNYVAPHFASIMIFHMLVILAIRADQINPSFGQTFSERITVIALVRDNPSGIFPGTTAPRSWDRDLINRRLQQLYLTRRGRIEMSTDTPVTSLAQLEQIYAADEASP